MTFFVLLLTSMNPMSEQSSLPRCVFNKRSLGHRQNGRHPPTWSTRARTQTKRDAKSCLSVTHARIVRLWCIEVLRTTARAHIHATNTTSKGGGEEVMREAQTSQRILDLASPKGCHMKNEQSKAIQKMPHGKSSARSADAMPLFSFASPIGTPDDDQVDIDKKITKRAKRDPHRFLALHDCITTIVHTPSVFLQCLTHAF